MAADHVDREHALQPLDRHRLEARLHVDDAGVVDERGERRQLGIEGGEHLQHLGLVGDVGLQGQRGAAGVADARDHALGGGGAVRVVHRDGPAVLRGEPAGGRADAATPRR